MPESLRLYPQKMIGNFSMDRTKSLHIFGLAEKVDAIDNDVKISGLESFKIDP